MSIGKRGICDAPPTNGPKFMMLLFIVGHSIFSNIFLKHVIGVMFKGYRHRHSTLPVEIEVDGVDKLRKALLRKKI